MHPKLVKTHPQSHQSKSALPARRSAPPGWLSPWLLLAGLICLLGGPARADFLPVEQAFQPEVAALSANELVVRWQIAPGYYLYQNKLRFRTETPGVTLGQPQLPPAEVRQDQFFGQVDIYRDQLEVRIPVERGENTAAPLTLLARFQGCADAGFCYPPQEVALEVALPAMSPVMSPTVSPATSPDANKVAASNLRAALGTSTRQSLGLDDDILPAAEAFVFSADIKSPNLLELRWTIAPETFMYRDMIALRLSPERAEAAGVQLGKLKLPEAEIKANTVRPDGSIGDVAIYHGLVTGEIPLLRSRVEAAEIELIATFQGCAERGICYPPVTKTVTLALPPTDRLVDAQTLAATQQVAAAEPTAGEARVSEQDQIAARLAKAGIFGALALFFGLGLLLAFTPCVFPMIPILSGIIAGQGQGITTRQAFMLSLAYVLAMALTYAIVGVIAGLFGANLQAAFQNPWILTLFAGIFVALALSMFGFYELQLPSSLQTRLTELSNQQQGGTLIGAAIMGALSALIVGPCVAPPLMGALIFIGKTGDAVLGFFALLGLGLGMGAPLLLIGTSAGKLLPRAGAWMDAVKAVFGVLLLAVAVLLLERILPVAIALLFWGLLLIASAVYLGALEPLPAQASGWRKLWKGLGVALMVYGALMLVGAAAGGRDTLQPLRGLMPAGGAQSSAHAEFKRIKTVTDLERELAAAATQGQPVMLDFYADWCVSCKEMERYTFPEPAVQSAMADFILLQADVTANDAEDRALMQERFGIPGPPAMLFFDTSGTELRGFRLVGFVPPEEFAAHLQEIQP
ncbi:protein-disulfide reductase DsbD [Thiorhodovibrio frisius]|uniref:Thiol:disulfide interchange protein DsbD n=1 Tax=Thiorhodovibrio frisius TaxID=631362 RepID=H8YYH4_9GAMM|nr:protein-disulfide reductase DsbD [Thiorhodovibrio frisius]EIC23500.1 thiol:disulfide interchange protein [Thiorhodovibrio frisius]WPL23413.1 Thiol:disulfide interchange protein DsbD precursor [Thiorhodovibrio frisius]